MRPERTALRLIYWLPGWKRDGFRFIYLVLGLKMVALGLSVWRFRLERDVVSLVLSSRGWEIKAFRLIRWLLDLERIAVIWLPRLKMNLLLLGSWLL